MHELAIDGSPVLPFRLVMTVATSRPWPKQTRSLLLRNIRGLSSSRALTWRACVPIAHAGIGMFNLAAHAAELPELTPAFLANNGFILICAALVIVMNAVNLLAKNLIVFALEATAY